MTRASSNTTGQQVIAGLLAGILVLIISVAFTTLIFTGPLGPYLGVGLRGALFASAAMALVLVVLGSHRGLVAGVAEPAAVLAVAPGAVAAALPAAAPAVQAGTAFAVILLATGLTGVLLGLLGLFRLGAMARYVPFPVVGGFLAGIGWLMVTGSFDTMAGPVIAGYGDLLTVEALRLWGPGALAGALLAFLRWRRPHPLLVPGFSVAVVGGFWIVAHLSGLDATALREQGWLFTVGLGDGGGTSLADPWRLLPAADWGVVLAQAPAVGAVLLVALVGLLLSGASLELIVHRDLDLDRELRAVGLGNLVGLAGGGLPGYHHVGASTLAHQIAGPGRVAPVMGAGVCMIGLAVGPALVEALPRLAAGMIVLALGLDFLGTWVVGAARRMERSEYGVVLLVLLTIASFGFLAGVALGLLAGVVLFAVSYSRVEVVRGSLSGAELRSNVDRPDRLREALREHAAAVHVFQLQGFLFFGTINRLMRRVRERRQRRAEQPLAYLVIDFGRVQGADSSVTMNLSRLTQLAQEEGFTLCLAAVPDRLAGALGPGPECFPDLDRALEWCEERLIAAHGLASAGAPRPLPDLLADHMGRDAPLDTVGAHFERVELAAGEPLIHQGCASDDLYLLESGRVSVEVATGNGGRVRLRVMGPGTVVGEIAFYLEQPRSASVVAVEPAVAHRLGRESLSRLRAEHPTAAADLHAVLARHLADRLADSNRLLQALSR